MTRIDFEFTRSKVKVIKVTYIKMGSANCLGIERSKVNVTNNIVSVNVLCIFSVHDSYILCCNWSW